MKPSPTRSSFTWIVTDRDGRIELLSRSAATLLGRPTDDVGKDLSTFFPWHRRAIATDMQIALTGWPSVRTVVLSPEARRPVTVRYLVSRHLLSPGVELHWTLDVVETDHAVS